MCSLRSKRPTTSAVEQKKFKICGYCETLEFEIADIENPKNYFKFAPKFKFFLDHIFDFVLGLGADILSEILLEQNGCGRNRSRKIS